jgi:hypothetical protein
MANVVIEIEWPLSGNNSVSRTFQANGLIFDDSEEKDGINYQLTCWLTKSGTNYPASSVSPSGAFTLGDDLEQLWTANFTNVDPGTYSITAKVASATDSDTDTQTGIVIVATGGQTRIPMGPIE